MNAQVEVSVYPLRIGKLAGPVEEFCEVLQSHGLHVETGSMSSFVAGESKELFNALREGFEALARRHEIVINCKISNACPDRAGDKHADIERNEANSKKEISTMRIAIPLAQGQLSLHFGHCDEFALVDVNSEEKTISGIFTETAPGHAPGVLPQWLGQQKVNVVIAGGMGSRAQALFAQNGIQVVVGAAAGTPEEVVNAYLNGTLQMGANICDH